MYFDFDDRFRDIEPVGSAINRRDGVAVAIVLHAVIVALLLIEPQYLQPYLPQQVVQPPPVRGPTRCSRWRCSPETPTRLLQM